MIDLIDVYSRPDRAQILYELLAERDESVNISHKRMPSWDEHVAFIEARMYEAWYFIEAEGECVGACYLTLMNEIGVHIFRQYQGIGYGTEAVLKVMSLNGPRRYLANINPRNKRSMEMFEKLGFRLLQLTLSRSFENSSESSASTPEQSTV